MFVSHLVVHGGESRHNVVGGLEELDNTVVELLLLIGGKSVARVGLLQSLLSAKLKHRREHLGVALHSDTVHVSVHFYSECVGSIYYYKV